MKLITYSVEDFVGKIVSSIEVERVGSCNQGPIDTIIFNFYDGDVFKMYHEQDCCESVFLEDITGDLDYLVEEKILKAEETSNQESGEHGSETWTFYHISTFKDTVSLRWYGESNGYYSESVSIAKLVDGKFETYR